MCTVFSVTGCDTVERIKERISQETVDDEKVADENKTEVSNSISVGLLDLILSTVSHPVTEKTVHTASNTATKPFILLISFSKSILTQ